MARHQAQHQRRLAVVVEVGPVHRHQDVARRPDLVRHPTDEAVPHVDARVAQQPVHLLDRMFGHQPARLRQCLADHRHRQRSARHHAKRGTRQRINPLGVKVLTIQVVDKPAHLHKPLGRLLRLAHANTPTQNESKHLHGRRKSQLHKPQCKMRGFMRWNGALSLDLLLAYKGI